MILLGIDCGLPTGLARGAFTLRAAVSGDASSWTRHHEAPIAGRFPARVAC